MARHCSNTCFARDPELLCTFVVHMAAAAVAAVPALVHEGRFEPETDAFPPNAPPEQCPACLPLGTVDSESAFGDTYRHAAVRERQSEALRGAMVRGELSAVLRGVSVVRSRLDPFSELRWRAPCCARVRVAFAKATHTDAPNWVQVTTAWCGMVQLCSSTTRVATSPCRVPCARVLPCRATRQLRLRVQVSAMLTAALDPSARGGDDASSDATTAAFWAAASRRKALKGSIDVPKDARADVLALAQRRLAATAVMLRLGIEQAAEL